MRYIGGTSLLLDGCSHVENTFRVMTFGLKVGPIFYPYKK